MKILTSEAVFRGHPDKICDQISDGILDACLKEDINSRVAIETLIKNHLVVVAGEVTTKANVNYEEVVYDVLKSLGYEDLEDFDIVVEVSKQSPDIALGVDKDGAGDQGIMYGYAVNECKELMPLSIVLARKIAICMDSMTKQIREVFGADGKCQVSVEYDENDKPKRIDTIVVSQQTAKGVERSVYTRFIIEECILKVIPGLTGRKIICDTYGGIGRHGGGAFSGKDATKVDRLGAYYARYVAKNIVAAGLANKCEFQVAYAIGIDKPVAVNIDTFGTSKYSNEQIKDAVFKFFNFSPKAMKTEIINPNVSFRSLAEYGHVGRSDIRVPWERTNKAYILKAYFKQKYAKRIRKD